MRYKRILKFLNRRSQSPRLPGVSPEKEFRNILERERARADRYGQGFSLVTFELGERDNGPGSLLPHILKDRIRSMDNMGWLDGKGIGVILPDTPPDGAHKLAEDVCKEIADHTAPPKFTVYTYPSQWLPRSDGDPTPPSITGTPSISNSGETNGSTTFMDGIGPLFGYQMPCWKRFIDIVGASLGLIFLSPLFMVIALFIKIVSPGPVFFGQQRLGYLGKPFSCWKFRTMTFNANVSFHRNYLNDLINTEKPMKKLDEDTDPRIIPLGRFFRSLGLDELPQLYNVVRGEMSLIGPRPCIQYEARKYLRWQNKRFDTRPGLTGLWQVSGKNRTTFKEMMRLDIRYSKQMSFRLDLVVLLKTIPAIIAQYWDSLSNRKEENYVERH